MMDVGGRRVLCWAQTGLPVRAQPAVAPADPPQEGLLTLNENLLTLQGRLVSHEEHLKHLVTQVTALEGDTRALRGDTLVALEKHRNALEAKLLALRGEIAATQQADLPLEILKIMHGALFETSQRYRVFLKGYSGKLPKWADDRETLET